MSDFAAYMLAQAETRAAYAEYNSAARGLELARIRERLAELRSQHEPLNSIGNRAQCIEAARYVVTGRRT